MTIFRSERNWPTDSHLSGLENMAHQTWESCRGKGVKEMVSLVLNTVYRLVKKKKIEVEGG